MGTEFVLFQAARPTVSPAYYLCVFRDVDLKEVRVAIGQSTGDATGPLAIELEEKEGAIATDAEIELYAGDWELKVYEQASSTNLDPAEAGRLVWEETVRVDEPEGDAPAREPYDPCVNCEGEACPMTVQVFLHGDLVETVNDVDPCVDNALNITLT